MYRIEHEKCDAGTTTITAVCTPLSLTYEPEMSLTVHLMVASINCGTLLWPLLYKLLKTYTRFAERHYASSP